MDKDKLQKQLMQCNLHQDFKFTRGSRIQHSSTYQITVSFKKRDPKVERQSDGRSDTNE